MKYYLDRDVTSADGSQTFYVFADSLEEAKQKFIAGDSDIEHSEVEVTQLADMELADIYTCRVV